MEKMIENGVQSEGGAMIGFEMIRQVLLKLFFLETNQVGYTAYMVYVTPEGAEN